MQRRCAVTAFRPGSVTVFQYGLLVHVVSVHARSGRTDTAMSSACPGLEGCIPERQRLVTRAPEHMGLTRHGPSSVHRTCADVVHTPTRRGHCTSGCSVLYTSVLGRLLPHRCFLPTELCSIDLPLPLPSHQTIQEQPPGGGAAARFGTARSWSRPQPRRLAAPTSGVAAT